MSSSASLFLVRAPALRRLPLRSALLLAGLLCVPAFANDYWLNAILIPFLILSLAGLGLNVLTGYAGQLSLGSAAFMAVGAYATYNLVVRLPGLPLVADLLLGGLIAAAIGTLFGLPSIRIKGFYLIVSTLAAQFFVEWIFTRVSWFSNNDSSGVLSAPKYAVFGWQINSPVSRYLFVLGTVVLLFAFAASVVRSELGRRWMAVRDMDTAAAVIGIPIAFGAPQIVTWVRGMFGT